MQQARVRRWRWWPLQQLACPNLPAGAPSTVPWGGGCWPRSLEINSDVLISCHRRRAFCGSGLTSFPPRSQRQSLPSRSGQAWAAHREVLLSQPRVWSQPWGTEQNIFSPSFPASNSNQVLRHLTCVLPWNCLSGANTHVRPRAPSIYITLVFVTQSDLDPASLSSTWKIRMVVCVVVVQPRKSKTDCWSLFFFLVRRENNDQEISFRPWPQTLFFIKCATVF